MWRTCCWPEARRARGRWPSGPLWGPAAAAWSAQLLAESLALCLVGGAAGVALAYGLLRAARPLLSLSLPSTAEVGLNPLVLAFAAAIVLGVSLLIGILPSLRASSGALSAFLNQAARGSSGSRAVLRRIIVAGEVAVSLVLICGASLMFRSLLNLQNGDAGVRIENVIATSVELPDRAYPTPESAVHFSEAVVERIEAMPGVERAAVATDVPLEGVNETEVLVAPGLYGTNVSYKRVDAHYFSTFDIPILSGRGIDDRDRRGTPPIVVVNQELAARVSQAFGVADPVGRTIGISHGDYVGLKAELTQFQIVGVIRSEQVGNLRDPGRPVVYVPFAQMPRQEIRLIVRARGEATAAVSGIREAVRQVDSHLPLGPVSTMAQVKERSFTDTTHSAWVIGAFAMVAALLAAFGLYGVLAQSVTQQRREIGIRMALGAGPREIVSGVLRNAMAMIAVGLAIGLAGAFALTGVMKSLLFQVSAFDPSGVRHCLHLHGARGAGGRVPSRQPCRAGGPRHDPSRRGLIGRNNGVVAPVTALHLNFPPAPSSACPPSAPRSLAIPVYTPSGATCRREATPREATSKKRQTNPWSPTTLCE